MKNNNNIMEVYIWQYMESVDNDNVINFLIDYSIEVN